VFFQVYRELGYGFLESVYRSAMTIALRDAGLLVEPEVELHAGFRGRSIGTFRADLLEEGAVLIELKAARAINSAHIAQLLNYLRCTASRSASFSTSAPAPRCAASFLPTSANTHHSRKLGKPTPLIPRSSAAKK
jgi:GxxExxY protein